jgi:hypothetical protein
MLKLLTPSGFILARLRPPLPCRLPHAKLDSPDGLLPSLRSLDPHISALGELVWTQVGYRFLC